MLGLRIGLSGVPPGRCPKLLVELLQIPAVVRAAFSPEDND